MKNKSGKRIKTNTIYEHFGIEKSHDIFSDFGLKWHQKIIIDVQCIWYKVLFKLGMRR